MKKHYLNSFLIIILLIFSVFLILPKEVKAETEHFNFHGYAWSSNIGWIDMSGVEYTVDNYFVPRGVTMSSASYVVGEHAYANLSGYAWSSNVGWISFNETNGCPPKESYDPFFKNYLGEPSSPCSARINLIINTGIGDTTNYFTGWAKILSYENDGEIGNNWADGWIKLSTYYSHNSGTLLNKWFRDGGVNIGCQSNIQIHGTNLWTESYTSDPYPPPTGECSGYAWGGNVTGWIDFSNVTVDTVPEPIITILANGTGNTEPSGAVEVTPGGSVLLTWSGENLCNTPNCARLTRTFDPGGANSDTPFWVSSEGQQAFDDLPVGTYLFNILVDSKYGPVQVGGKVQSGVYVHVGYYLSLTPGCEEGQGTLTLDTNLVAGEINYEPSTHSLWPTIPAQVPDNKEGVSNGNYYINAGGLNANATVDCSGTNNNNNNQPKIPNYKEN